MVDKNDTLVDIVEEEFGNREGVVPFATVQDGKVDDLRQVVAVELRNSECLEIDERLQSLVVDVINALPEIARNVCGRVRSGEEIARAIPDVEAFLAEMSLMKEGKFFAFNDADQLVMVEGGEAHSLDETFLKSKKRQTRVVYRGNDGMLQVINGDEYFLIDESGNLLLSEAAKRIPADSIIMERGVPTAQSNSRGYCVGGEFFRMKRKRLIGRNTNFWVEDDSLECSDARFFIPSMPFECCSEVGSLVRNSNNYSCMVLGSRSVLRVNLNFEA